MPNRIPRLMRLNTSVTVPLMTALEDMAEKEGKHKSEIVRNALEAYFEMRGLKIHGKSARVALLNKKRRARQQRRRPSATYEESHARRKV